MRIQHDNLLHAFGMGIDRMNVQIAKALSQRALLLWRDSLFAQEHHLMSQYRMVKLLKLIVAQRTGQIRPRDLRADIRPQRGNAQTFTHWTSPCQGVRRR